MRPYSKAPVSTSRRRVVVEDVEEEVEEEEEEEEEEEDDEDEQPVQPAKSSKSSRISSVKGKTVVSYPHFCAFIFLISYSVYSRLGGRLLNHRYGNPVVIIRKRKMAKMLMRMEIMLHLKKLGPLRDLVRKVVARESPW